MLAQTTAADNRPTPPRDFRMTRTCRLLVRGKNVHPETLLATDYLNHFNEVVMLIEMVPAMPECLEDLRAWHPKTYAEHFLDSSFADRELAVLAYENAPPEHRAPFDATIQRLNVAILAGIEAIGQAVATGDAARIEHVATSAAMQARALIDVASGIIHGHHDVANQSQIDDLMKPERDGRAYDATATEGPMPDGPTAAGAMPSDPIQ